MSTSLPGPAAGDRLRSGRTGHEMPSHLATDIRLIAGRGGSNRSDSRQTRSGHVFIKNRRSRPEPLKGHLDGLAVSPAKKPILPRAHAFSDMSQFRRAPGRFVRTRRSRSGEKAC